MASNAYPISAPVTFTGTGAIYFANTGAINFNNQNVTGFVTSSTGSTIYVGAGGALVDLPIGLAGQYLKVNAGATGPIWATLPAEGPIFSAFSTGAIGTVAASTSWTVLDDTVVGWDMSIFNGVTGASFDVSTGQFTADADGVYEFACSVAFQGNNTGNQVSLTSPAGLASRQVAFHVNANATPSVLGTRQAEASNSNATQVAIYNAKLSLSASDTVEVRIRHDATIALDVLGDSRTSFSGSRVR